MARRLRASAPASVFLNVPFSARYEGTFVALICAVVASGRVPRSVVEVPESGRGRLRRLIGHLRACQVSVHDLSWVGSPSRFNMPFELGIAAALQHFSEEGYGDVHQRLVLERVNHRLSRTLSDLAGTDPMVYGQRPERALVQVYSALTYPHRPSVPSVAQVRGVYRGVRSDLQSLKVAFCADSAFDPQLFGPIVVAATERASNAGLIT